MKNMVSVVIPTYKEVKNIPVLSEKLAACFKSNKTDYEIIIVDDNSNDGTEEVVSSIKKKFNINLIVRKTERGLSSAVITGFKQVKGTTVIVMDADLSHPVEAIPQMMKAIDEKGADFVIGSRNVPGGSADTFNWYRKLNAFVSRTMARPFAKVTDPMAGFFCFPSRILTEKVLASLNPIGWKIGLELLVKANPSNVIEVPIKFNERLYGESKLTFKEQFNYLKHLWRLFDYKYKSLLEIIKFALVGGTGTLVDLLVLFGTHGLLDIRFEIAKVISFIVAVTSNFILNRAFTFPEARGNHWVRQYTRFVGTCIIGFVVNWSISVYLNRYIPFFTTHYLIASLLGIISGMTINFVGSKFFAFNKK